VTYGDCISYARSSHSSYRTLGASILDVASSEYWVTGRRKTRKDPKLEFRVHVMNLSRDDNQNMQLNLKHIPSPTVNDRFSSCFHVRIGQDIAYERDFAMLVAHPLQDFI